MSKRLTKPRTCIECLDADCFGYCKILKDRQEDYALKRHKNCPIGKGTNEKEYLYTKKKK